MTPSMSQWKPSADIKTHKGDSIPQNLIFFTPPPREIVNLRSAVSTLESGKPAQQIDRYHASSKILAAVCFAFVGALITFLIVGIPLSGVLNLKSETVPLIAALIVAGIILFLMLRGEWKLPTYCSYIGDNGVANYAFGKEANAKHGTGLFLFHQAEELRVMKFRQFVKRSYQYTTYIFEWKNANDEIVFSINGLHRSRDDNPPALDRYYFALAAERAWSLYKIELIEQELKNNGTVKFSLQKNDEIIVNKDYIELILKGNSYRLNKDEINKISLSNGVIHIIPKEVRNSFLGFAHDGILRVAYKDIANAQIFITVFDMLINRK